MATLDIRAKMEEIDIIQFADDTGSDEYAYKMELIFSGRFVSLSSYDDERMYMKVKVDDIDNLIIALTEAKRLINEKSKINKK